MTATEKEPDAKASKPDADDGVVRTLTVPAKPALISAANVTTMAGTAAWVAGGPLGLVAGAAAAGVTAVALHRTAKHRQQRREEAARRAAAGAGSGARGSGGRSGAGAGNRAGGGGRSASGGGTGARSGGLAGGRSRGGRLARAWNAARGRVGGTSGATRAGGGSGLGRGGGSSRGGGGAGSRSRAGRWTRGRGGAAAKWAGRGAARGVGWTAQGTARAARAAGRGAKNAYAKARRWTRRNVLGHSKANGKNAALAGATKPCVQVKPPAATVNRPPTQTPNAAKPKSTGTPQRQQRPSVPQQVRRGRPVPAPITAKGTTMSGLLLQHARQMYAYACTFEPKGMLGPVEPGGDFHDMSEALGWVRASIGNLMDKAATKWPLDPSVAQVMAQVVQNLNAAAEGARELKPAIEAMHKAELDRLRNPRPGEEKWDVSANR